MLNQSPAQQLLKIEMVSQHKMLALMNGSFTHTKINHLIKAGSKPYMLTVAYAWTEISIEPMFTDYQS